jgi:hypothetical protein
MLRFKGSSSSTGSQHLPRSALWSQAALRWKPSQIAMGCGGSTSILAACRLSLCRAQRTMPDELESVGVSDKMSDVTIFHHISSGRMLDHAEQKFR